MRSTSVSSFWLAHIGTPFTELYEHLREGDEVRVGGEDDGEGSESGLPYMIPSARPSWTQLLKAGM